jgi:hypothetical protein
MEQMLISIQNQFKDDALVGELRLLTRFIGKQCRASLARNESNTTRLKAEMETPIAIATGLEGRQVAMKVFDIEREFFAQTRKITEECDANLTKLIEH